MSYITPAKLRTSGIGNDLSTFDDLALRSILVRASALVDAYCAVPLLPTRHDFRGGSITAEQHGWPLPDMSLLTMSGRQVYPNHKPLKTVTKFVVKFTNTYQVEVDPANLYVNRLAGWAQVVSIAAVVSGVYPVGINFGLYTPIAEIDYTYGFTFPVSGEHLELMDAGEYQAQNQFWSSTPAPIVYKNGVVQSSGFTLDSTEGTVSFTTAPDARTDVITLDYTYTLPWGIAQATALIASKLISEADLIAKGMGNLNTIRVEEVELRRSFSNRPNAQTDLASVDPLAATYLEPFRFISIR